VPQLDSPRLEVDVDDLAEHDLDVLELAQHRTDWNGDVGRPEPRQSHLIEQRLKQVVVDAVVDRHAHRLRAEALRGAQTTEAAADDDDVRNTPCAVPTAHAVSTARSVPTARAIPTARAVVPESLCFDS